MSYPNEPEPAGALSTITDERTQTSTGEAVQFWILGTVAVLGALGTVLMKKSVHSALSLAGTMIVLAVFYLAQGAYFLGIVQIFVPPAGDLVASVIRRSAGTAGPIGS